MPLIKGKSDRSFSKNVETEMNAGKPQDQSLAIAYAMKRKAQKMAKGGQVSDSHEEHPDLDTAGMSVIDRIMAKRSARKAGEEHIEELPEDEHDLSDFEDVMPEETEVTMDDAPEPTAGFSIPDLVARIMLDRKSKKAKQHKDEE